MKALPFVGIDAAGTQTVNALRLTCGDISCFGLGNFLPSVAVNPGFAVDVGGVLEASELDAVGTGSRAFKSVAVIDDEDLGIGVA